MVKLFHLYPWLIYWKLKDNVDRTNFVHDGKPLGCLVDEILFEQEVKPQPQGLILKRVRNVSGSTILNTGEVCLILNPDDLIRTAEKNLVVSRST